MANQRVIVNLGFARCGTTATDKFFRKHADVGTPKARKELKYFLGPFKGAADYTEQFSDPKELLFEASPPYVHGGLDRFEAVLRNIDQLRAEGVSVTLLFCLRNLLSRAFSHYWHDIGSQYARFGSGWAVRDVDHPQRYASVYTRSFLGELSNPKSADKFLPPVMSLIRRAIDQFGTENVRIGYTKDLNNVLSALLSEIGLQPEEPIKTARITGAAAPVYVYSPSASTTVVETNDGPRLINLPEDHCLLFSRHSSEVLKAKDWPLARIVAASTTWTRVLPVDCIPDGIMDQIRRASDGLENLPDECFLAESRDKLLKDLSNMPEQLKIKPLKPSAEVLQKIVEKVQSST